MLPGGLGKEVGERDIYTVSPASGGRKVLHNELQWKGVKGPGARSSAM